ncbi:MAG TPA: hypothetical protein VIU61_18080 [Kofleriaceae bacterium]
MRRALLVGLVLAAAPAQADAPELVALAPPAGDDARKAIAIGPSGEVYEPDGKGAWTRRNRITTADRLTIAGRAGAGGPVIASGDGVLYRLAANGWTALRLAQKGKATLSGGLSAIAAVGRQLYAIDQLAGGKAAKLALAPATVLAIGAGKKPAIATERGLYRFDGKKLAPILGAPKRVDALVGERWAVLDHGVHELATRKLVRWPAGLKIALTGVAPDGSVAAVATSHGKLELVALRAGKVEREPIELPAVPGAKSAPRPVGFAIDKSGRAVIALRDGRLAIRERGVWRVATISEALPSEHPGSPPANSP